MRPAPRGYSSALLCNPISFSLPEKEMGSPAKGKESVQDRECIPCRHHVTAHLPGLVCPPQLTSPLATPRRTLS